MGTLVLRWLGVFGWFPQIVTGDYSIALNVENEKNNAR